MIFKTVSWENVKDFNEQVGLKYSEATNIVTTWILSRAVMMRPVKKIKGIREDGLGADSMFVL